MHLVKRKTCRVCGSKSLTPAVDLGEQFLQGAFQQEGKAPPLRKVPTALVRCNPMRDETACGLLQMEYTVPPEVLYASYWYVSGTNATMREHLSGIVEELNTKFGTGPNVLDIGCNDGTLLKAYSNTLNRYGVDPSDVTHDVDGLHIIHEFFPSNEATMAFKERRFDTVTSIAMFYDLEDPVAFAKAIKAVLVSNGIWCFEMSYMPSMLATGSYDTIVGEHIEYYSLAVLERIMKEAGLKIVSVSQNNINGGSLRCYATHASSAVSTPEDSKQLSKLRLKEFELALDTDRPYRIFQERAETNKAELLSLLRRLKSEGKTIHGYGASTKGNTILQWCGIDGRLLDMIADRNPAKDGAYTLGTEIPIVNEAHSRSKRPDYYLVLPWHFKDEFLQREKATMQQGTKMIFPLPNVEIVY